MADRRLRVAVIATLFVLLQACSAVTRFESVKPDTVLVVHGDNRNEVPRQLKLASKATRQYEFKATSPTGATMYGILPLSVNGGKMAASILLFAPALFIGGFRDVFPYYRFDPDAGVLHYKVKGNDEWRIYDPSIAESDRAKRHFDSAGLN